MLGHGPFSKAFRAAFTASSTSVASASATWQISSPVAGLIVGKVFPEWLFTQRLLMKSLVGPTAIEGSFGSVAMSFTPYRIVEASNGFLGWGSLDSDGRLPGRPTAPRSISLSTAKDQ